MSGASRTPEQEALPVRDRPSGAGGAAAHAVPADGRRASVIWRAAANGEPPEVGATVLAILARAGPGRPLPGDLLARMELALGASFGAVRIHTDPEAAEAASELDARAFTVMHDIYFGAGQYNPGTGEGRDLIAHELAHTLQPRPFRPDAVGAPAPDPLAPQAEEVPEVAEPDVEVEEEPGEEPAVDEEAAVGEEAEPEPAAEGPAPPVGEGAGPGDGEGGEGGEEAPAEGGRPDVELIMPPPPAALSPPAQERLGASQAAAGSAATSARDMPSAEESTAEARGAVTEPEAETTGRAESALAEALAIRPEPSPEILQLCDDIRESIRAKRPLDEDELVDADPEEAAQEAGGELNEAVEGDTGRVEGEYAELQEPQEGTAALEPTPVAEQPGEVPLADPNAAAAAPDPVGDEQVSLEADVEAADQDIVDAGMTTEPAELVEDGPIAEAREARGDLGETAQRGPAEVLAEQDAALTQASSDMAALQDQALAALTDSRTQTVAGVGGQQTQMVGSEEQIREQVSTQARQIFTDAQTRVRDLLEPLPETAMEKYNAGVGRLKTVFRQKLDRVKAWIEERHSGVGGAILGAWDALTGLPGWVTDSYDEAEQAFGDGICDLITEISVDVNAVVAACEAIIEDARSRIADLFSNLPEGLQEWAAAEQAQLNEQLDGLHGEVMAARDSFNEDMSRRAVQAVREVQDEVAKLREEAKGLIGKIADAIAAFIDDPAKFIIEGLLKLVGIDPAAFWRLVDKIGEVISDIADDPMRFVNNLVAGIGQGFQQFFDNFPAHLLQGFFDWLFAGLGSVGVQLPADFSLKSIITFILQLLGLTWARIREILVRHIGEENVALIEKAWELVTTLIEQGPEGIFEMIKEQLDPAQILSQILDAAIQYVVETLIKQVTVRVIALFNPAGAIVQAIELIYKVLKWVFENAARIFSFVETVVNGMADVLAGNISGVASAVEQALAKLIPPVIDFLAGLLGLGDLPDKVVEVIKGMQDWILGIVDRVVGWLVAQGKKLLEAVGLGGGGEEAPPEGATDRELGTTVTFGGGGESHRQWVQMEGAEATLMVASETPMTVTDKLVEWRSKLVTHFPDDQAGQREEASGLLDSASTVLNSAESSKEALEAAYAAANRAQGEDVPEIPSDDPLEAQQRALGSLLGRLYALFGEEQPGGGVPPILGYVGRLVVNRGQDGAADTEASGIELPPEGYTMPKSNNRIHIQRRNASDERTPVVSIDDGGVLREGPARPQPAGDQEKIEQYQKVLTAAGVAAGQWPTDEKADDYRRSMRALVVGAFRGNLTGLNDKVIQVAIVPPQYNRVIGEIFEDWVRANLAGVVPGRPQFVPAVNNNLTQSRMADAQIQGNILIEAKGIRTPRPPSADEESQMQDYAHIVRPPGVPWLKGGGDKPEPVIFGSVRYVFNHVDIAAAWKVRLDALLRGLHTTMPEVEPPR